MKPPNKSPSSRKKGCHVTRITHFLQTNGTAMTIIACPKCYLHAGNVLCEQRNPLQMQICDQGIVGTFFLELEGPFRL